LPKPALLRTAAEVRDWLRDWRARGSTIAFVPTMGNLHAGHLSLTELAHEHAEQVVMSIFVNPTQFGPGEDFAAYPRTLEEDIERIEAAGMVGAVFVPEVAEIYPFGLEHAVRLSLPPLAQELCGRSRPGHFDGVANVVCRLLNIVAPDVLVLGEKDYQQLILMRRMTADLRLPVGIVGGPTRREPDGLALSSRNRYLSAAERTAAPALSATLRELASALRERRAAVADLEADALSKLAAAGLKPDYVEVRRAADLARPTAVDAPPTLIALAAAWLGRTRLIDNVKVQA
jgi:pantoate--beta-alanine ligase